MKTNYTNFLRSQKVGIVRWNLHERIIIELVIIFLEIILIERENMTCESFMTLFNYPVASRWGMILGFDTSFI